MRSHTIDQMIAIDEYLDHYTAIAANGVAAFDRRLPHNRDSWAEKERVHWTKTLQAIRWLRANNQKRIRAYERRQSGSSSTLGEGVGHHRQDTE